MLNLEFRFGHFVNYFIFTTRWFISFLGDSIFAFYSLGLIFCRIHWNHFYFCWTFLTTEYCWNILQFVQYIILNKFHIITKKFWSVISLDFGFAIFQIFFLEIQKFVLNESVMSILENIYQNNWLICEFLEYSF